MNKTGTILYLSISTVVLSACGSSDNSVCDIPLTVSYVNNEFLSEPGFVFNNFSVSDTTLIHSDGNQNSAFDIDTIIMSRVTQSDDLITFYPSLVLSYSIHATTRPSIDTFMAFYIDTDNNPLTGKPISATLGAEALLLNDSAMFEVPYTASSFSYYYEWSGTNWVAQTPLASYAGNSSYLQGCTLSVAVHAPLYNGLSALYATPARGVMKLVTLTTANPNTVASEIDTTTEFNFTVP